MTGPQPTAPGGVSQSDVRKAIAIARMVLLLCALGAAGILSRVPLLWRGAEARTPSPSHGSNPCPRGPPGRMARGRG